MRRQLWSVGVLAAGLLTACGYPASAPPPVYEGHPDGPPSMLGLPSLDVPARHLSPQMHLATTLCEESLRIEAPTLPTGHGADELQAWTENTLGPWMHEKSKLSMEARIELDKAAGENQRQRIMAGALVGLMYEDLARVFVSLPVPTDLQNEPEIAQTFREVISSYALPYLTLAEHAYKACAGNAVQLASMQHWAGYCSARWNKLSEHVESDARAPAPTTKANELAAEAPKPSAPEEETAPAPTQEPAELPPELTQEAQATPSEPAMELPPVVVDTPPARKKDEPPRPPKAPAKTEIGGIVIKESP